MNRTLQSSFVLILLSSLHNASGEDQVIDAGQPPPVVTVRIYDYARVAFSILAQAVANAEQVFETAGVEVKWLQEPGSLATDAQGQSSGHVGPADLLLRILPRELARRFHPKPSIVGIAHMSHPSDHARMASVFFHRIESLSEAEGLQEGPLLGHVLAHETGHLLLGRGRHAKKGLMRCPWGKRELKEAARGRLRFSPQEARRIRGRIRDRMEARGIQVAEREAAGALVAKAAPEAW